MDDCIGGKCDRVDKLLHLYHLKESKEFRYYELVPWDRKSRLIVSLPFHFATGSLGTSLSQEMAGKPFRMTFGETYLGCCIGGGHPDLVRLPSFLLHVFFLGT